MPFKGSLVERMKLGSAYFRYDDKCGFRCNPIATMDRGVKTLALFRDLLK